MNRMPTWLPAALRLGHGYHMTSLRRVTPQGTTLHARVREIGGGETDMVLNEAQWVWALDKACDLLLERDRSSGVSMILPGQRRCADELNLDADSKLWKRYWEIKADD